MELLRLSAHHDTYFYYRLGEIKKTDFRYPTEIRPFLLFS